MTASLRELPRAGACDRRLAALNLPAFGAPLGRVTLPSPHFVCLLCGDARSAPDSAVLDSARALLDLGAVYLCAWGPDCLRVRSLFENVALARNARAEVAAMHFYEDLDDAADYFLNVAQPVEDYAATCRTGLVLNVGAAPWNARVRDRLDAACSAAAAAPLCWL